MKKIMFNDKLLLTEAVLQGRKTMTRRIAYDKPLERELHTGWDSKGHFVMCDGWMQVAKSAYAEDEVVAIAQKYIDLKDCDAFYERLRVINPTLPLECIEGEKGCYNKMFVAADLMPHQLRITHIKLERLQDISDADILREGVFIDNARTDIDNNIYAFDVRGKKHTNRWWFPTAKLAFATLIDRVSGRGTWESNPWVFAYSFELVK